jgi:hypothetical protein
MADKTQGTATGNGGPHEASVYPIAPIGSRTVNKARRTRCDDQNDERWKVWLSVRGGRERDLLKNDAFWNGIANSDPATNESTQSPTKTGRSK